MSARTYLARLGRALVGDSLDDDTARVAHQAPVLDDLGHALSALDLANRRIRDLTDALDRTAEALLTAEGEAVRLRKALDEAPDDGQWHRRYLLLEEVVRRYDRERAELLHERYPAAAEDADRERRHEQAERTGGR